MPSREGPVFPPPAQPRRCGAGGLLRAGDRPAEAGQLARDRDRDQGAALAAALHAPPRAVQALLRAPADRDRLDGLAGLAVGELAAHARRVAVMPRRLDEQAARVARAGLG